MKVLQDAAGVPDNMIVGMAGVLDSARFAPSWLGMLGVSINQSASLCTRWSW